MTSDPIKGKTKTEPSTVTVLRSPSITTAKLMGTSRELLILHGEDQYRLRITGSGKLILTK